MKTSFQDTWRGIWNFLMPRCCMCCGRRLLRDEHYLCASCLTRRPDDIHDLGKMEALEYTLRAELPLVHARALYRYGLLPETRRLVFQLKYNGQPEVGEWMGRQLAHSLNGTDFFEGIDYIVPVPLHPRRLRKRGYNQAEVIARSVSQLTGIPLCTNAVRRDVNTHTQTHLDFLRRQRNMQHVFLPAHTEPLAGKHLLIVDDVMTTGATVTACAKAFEQVPGHKISVLTFAYADRRN
jgi:ComF family protein